MDQNTDSPTGDETPAPAATRSLAQKLAARLTGRGEPDEVAALNAQIATLTNERDTAQTAAVAAQVTISGLQTELATARQQIQEAEAELSKFDARVQSASIARVAAAGIPLEELPKVAEAGEDPAAKLRAELNALPANDSVRRGEIVGKLLKLRNGNN